MSQLSLISLTSQTLSPTPAVSDRIHSTLTSSSVLTINSAFRNSGSGLLRQIGPGPSLAGLSRFFSQAPWEAKAVAERRLRHFRETMQAQTAELERQRQEPRMTSSQPERGLPKSANIETYSLAASHVI